MKFKRRPQSSAPPPGYIAHADLLTVAAPLFAAILAQIRTLPSRLTHLGPVATDAIAAEIERMIADPSSWDYELPRAPLSDPPM